MRENERETELRQKRVKTETVNARVRNKERGSKDRQVMQKSCGWRKGWWTAGLGPQRLRRFCSSLSFAFSAFHSAAAFHSDSSSASSVSSALSSKACSNDDLETASM